MKYAIIILLIINIGQLIMYLLNYTKKNNDAVKERDDRQEIVRYLSENQRQQIETLHQMQMKLMGDNAMHQERISIVLRDALEKMMSSNEHKLSGIEQTINDKLDRSLNERLDSSFKTIGRQLSDLYRSLGELSTLTDGVHDLNRTLSNVKTRGIWGEMQLEHILENIMSPVQYDKNVAVKKNSQERVEFAIKIPDKEHPSQFLYLPIDSKMPMDIYEKIIDAAEDADAISLKQSIKELENRIKTEAKTIRDKYIAPPSTTDFAILFLPTENLFAEVLRIPGLAEWCQQKYKIIVAGPTTITALLNSLQVGFRYLTVNKNSQDVLKLLSSIKAQYGKLNELIDKTQKKLDEAKRTTDDLKIRNDQIHKSLLKVDEIDFSESNSILGLDD